MRDKYKGSDRYLLTAQEWKIYQSSQLATNKMISSGNRVL